MQPVISPAESARLDAAADAPIPVLMDRAGLGVALAAVELGVGYGSRVAVLAGPGNNGGDGYVAARYLQRRGAQVTVHALAFPRGNDAATVRTFGGAAVHAGVGVQPLGAVEAADLVIDALFGAGFRGRLPEVVLPWLDADTPVLAVDVPSGLDASDGAVRRAAFTATRTVTFEYLKTGHLVGEGPDRCGRIDVVPIGLPTYDGVPSTGGDEGPDLLLCEEADAPRPTRSRTAHKWSAGSVAVVGGAPGITGAPMLAATAALNFGAGAAAVICPGALQPTLAAMSAGVMSLGAGDGRRFTPADVGDILAAAERYNVMALGPGLGPGQEKVVAELADRWHGPLLIDADGLNAIADPTSLAGRNGDTVLTPHTGEFARLADFRPDHHGAALLANRSGAVVLLKGAPTFVAGRRTWVVAAGGPELATIGTGDVLTGMIAALWSRGLSVEEAARSGAFWHGVAGAKLHGYGTVTGLRLADEVAAWAEE